jgi:hypothetical protein
MKMNVFRAGLGLAAALLATPALAAEPLTLECEWQRIVSTSSSFDSTKKKDKPQTVMFTFDFDKGDVVMEGLEGKVSDLRPTTNTISFCIDACAKSGPFERVSPDGPVKVTVDAAPVTINRLTGDVSWARTEEAYQGSQHYKTSVYEYAGDCKKAAARVPLF